MTSPSRFRIASAVADSTYEIESNELLKNVSLCIKKVVRNFEKMRKIVLP